MSTLQTVETCVIKCQTMFISTLSTDLKQTYFIWLYLYVKSLQSMLISCDKFMLWNYYHFNYWPSSTFL